MTNNRRSDFCQPYPESSPNTADNTVIPEALGLPTAVIILISALAILVVVVLIALGTYGFRKLRSLSVVTEPLEVQGWFSLNLTFFSRNTPLQSFLGSRSSIEAESQPCLRSLPIREPPPPYNEVHIQGTLKDLQRSQKSLHLVTGNFIMLLVHRFARLGLGPA